jgi:hypothetical protein
MNAMRRTPSEIMRAAVLMGHLFGSLEDEPAELADIVAYQCLRMIQLTQRLTRGGRLRLAWSVIPDEQRAIEELGKVEVSLDAVPRLLRLLREAKLARRSDEVQHWTEVAADYLRYDIQDAAGKSAEQRRQERAGRKVNEITGLYRELRETLGACRVAPLPD